MNPNEHDTDNQFADLAQIADQDDDSAEELQFSDELFKDDPETRQPLPDTAGSKQV